MFRNSAELGVECCTLSVDLEGEGVGVDTEFLGDGIAEMEHFCTDTILDGEGEEFTSIFDEDRDG